MYFVWLDCVGGHEMIGRRSLLRALGAAPAALAAVPSMLAASAKTASLGMETYLEPDLDWSNPNYGTGSQAKNCPTPETYDQKLSRYLNTHGELPPTVVHQIRENERRQLHLSRLDPDLVDNKSFSLSTKIRIQFERNVNYEVAQRREHAKDDKISEW